MTDTVRSQAVAALAEAEKITATILPEANAAQVTLAEASAESIRRVTVSLGEQQLPMMYLLGEKYVAALGKLGESPNAKIVVLPADLQDAVAGIFARAQGK